mmetsp:Transcript_10691/g.30024  ORF Transcript_10691/g.30024 Transcript_10691/m.30024 type:complete len:334 (-) Transcript_10691:157-1158(-)|eukprot:CAMPEP_0119123462 /NCGR_PEP_ID=MMETSP1310-20130426/3401_1 /TAXON_ID=464262 /ORGANISM="Genus nov. species nov., Strain RCC2339" /LENGTH=333 /DNA_ID=CAMNT_0007113291 /DNA_START=50 /DNA_END=1051 /DNA_ORIENTATION=+
MGKKGGLVVISVALALGFLSYTAYQFNRKGGLFDPAPELNLDYRGNGKLAVVTGANTGLGKEVAKGLYKVGFKVVMACRSDTKCKKAKREIEKEVGPNDGTLLVEVVDLSSFTSVQSFAFRLIREYSKVNVLIQNAGLWSDCRPTEDGVGRSAQVNHYSNFLLQELLLNADHVEKDGRIIIVSSALAWKARDFRNDPSGLDCSWDTSTAMWGVYGTSKLMNIINARSLAKRVASKGILVNAVHPGVIQTELHRNDSGAVYAAVRTILYSLAGLTPWEGAQPMLHLATATSPSSLFTGQYVAGALPRDPPALALDEELEAFLWNHSLETVQIYL